MSAQIYCPQPVNRQLTALRPGEPRFDDKSRGCRAACHIQRAGNVSTAFLGGSVGIWAGDRPGLAKGGDRWSLLQQQHYAPRATAGSAPR